MTSRSVRTPPLYLAGAVAREEPQRHVLRRTDLPRVVVMEHRIQGCEGILGRSGDLVEREWREGGGHGNSPGLRVGCDFRRETGSRLKVRLDPARTASAIETSARNVLTYDWLQGAGDAERYPVLFGAAPEPPRSVAQAQRGCEGHRGNPLGGPIEAFWPMPMNTLTGTPKKTFRRCDPSHVYLPWRVQYRDHATRSSMLTVEPQRK